MKLHRSLIFWAGIVVMISVCWAWWDSTRTIALASSGDHVVISAGSGISVTARRGFGQILDHDDLAGDLVSLREVGLRWPVLLRKTSPGWQAEMTERYMRPGPDGKPDSLHRLIYPTLLGRTGEWYVYVPYWLVMLGATLIWCWGLERRWLRIKRARTLEGGGG